MAIIDLLQWRAGFVPLSRRLQKWCASLCWVLLLGFNSIACAHDPGLSYAKIAVERSHINVDLSFARRDIELLQKIDLSGDGLVSEDELAMADLSLSILVSNWVLLESEGRGITGVVDTIEYDTSDALHFSLKYPRSANSEIRYHAPIISQLVLGHRQFVGIYQAGDLVRNEVLSATDNPIELNLRPVDLWRQNLEFLTQGIWHIWIGYDHILFLLAMLLPAVLMFENGGWHARREFKSTLIQVLKIVSAFTLAHSITLSLAVLGPLSINLALVESVIAASVIVAAVNNLHPFIGDRIWLMAFGFGLIHGFGFASVLADLGLPTASKGIALLGFNIGVELGQLVIVALALPLMFTLRNQPLYRPVVLGTGSIVIGIVASIWFIERLSDLNLPSISTFSV